MNKLLQKQLKKYLGDQVLPSGFDAFIIAVEDTYVHYEKDRVLLEHTMELNSNELAEANKKLTLEAEENHKVFDKLTESLQLLKENDALVFQETSAGVNLLNIAEVIKEQAKYRKMTEQTMHEHVANLEKINRELDQFAYVVSHDLKAPLRAMSSLITWIEEDSGPYLTADSKENLKMIVQRVNRMSNLINGILAYSKAGKGKVEKVETNVKELVDEIIDSNAIQPNIKIVNKISVSEIITEKIKLNQVFSNLISNAIKYNDKSEIEIEVGSYEYDDWYQFYVKDNGPGIEKEYHEKIFMIFQTLVSRDEVESTGIGLSIVKKIIEEQSGKIWVESQPGIGSRFVFTWRAVKSNATSHHLI